MIERLSRASDERLLRWLRLRRLQMSVLEIARRSNVSVSQVIRATDRVVDADVAECGEHVRKAYWL